MFLKYTNLLCTSLHSPSPFPSLLPWHKKVKEKHTHIMNSLLIKLAFGVCVDKEGVAVKEDCWVSTNATASFLSEDARQPLVFFLSTVLSLAY